MAASRYEIRSWVEAGVVRGATHIVVVCDEFDHEDYPIEVSATQDVCEVVRALEAQSMQRVMEVYAAHLPVEAQLAEPRAWHCEAAAKA